MVGTEEIREQSMQGVDISGQDRAQQFECLYPGDHWGPAHTDRHWPGRHKYSWRHAPPLSSIISTSPHHSLPWIYSCPPHPWQSDRATASLWWNNCQVRLLIWFCQDQNCQNIFLSSNYFKYFITIIYLEDYDLLIVDLTMRPEIVCVLYCVNNNGQQMVKYLFIPDVFLVDPQFTLSIPATDKKTNQ